MTTYTFIVTGRGEFPIDMLRYDQCHPVTEAHDSSAIERSFRRENAGIDQRVKLTGLNQPTIGRWKSFGWRVVEVVENGKNRSKVIYIDPRTEATR